MPESFSKNEKIEFIQAVLTPFDTNVCSTVSGGPVRFCRSGLFFQTTLGNYTDRMTQSYTKKSFLSIVQQSWMSFEGLSPAQARKNYIALVSRINNGKLKELSISADLAETLFNTMQIFCSKLSDAQEIRLFASLYQARHGDYKEDSKDPYKSDWHTSVHNEWKKYKGFTTTQAVQIYIDTIQEAAKN